MKSIETTTKLQLRRETLRELTADDLRQAAGGTTNMAPRQPNCV